MATLIHAQPDDEIADLIAKLTTTSDPTVGVVLPPGSRAVQTPLNARLLHQFGRRNGRTVAIVSDEPRIQELARQQGLTVYPSVVSFNRGMELAGGGGAVRGATATAVRESPAAVAAPPAPPPPPHAPAVPPSGEPGWGPAAGAATGAGAAAAGAATADAAAGTPGRRSTFAGPSSGGGRSRWWYVGGGAVLVIGLLLFFTLAPTATVTITVAATPVSVSPTIQGSTDPAAAQQGNHILTQVVTANASGQFTATPTGSSSLPATPATTKLVFSTNNPSGGQFELSKGAAFTTSDGTQNFVVTQDTYICLGSPGGNPPTAAECDGQTPNDTASVQAQNAGAAGNVGAGDITKWGPSNPDPCTNNAFCTGPSGQTYDIYLTNPDAATGGADPKQVTVASQSDVNGWTSQVSQIENQLTNQINSQLQQKAGGATFAVDPGGNGKSIAFTVQPQLPNPGDQFSTAQITVTANGTAVAYSAADVRNDILADLNSQLAQGDQLAPGKLSIQPCSVTQAGTDGTVVLACSATDLEQPQINIAGLKQQLAGKSPGDAQPIVQGSVDKVQDVQVSEFPFRLWYLPLFSSRIAIDETFVSGQTTSP